MNYRFFNCFNDFVMFFLLFYDLLRYKTIPITFNWWAFLIF